MASPPENAGQPLRVWTVGHSTHDINEFIDILTPHGVGAVADVRRFPASRRHPQFNRGALASALTDAGIGYLWLPELGGRRRPRADSPHTAWRNASFRGYADYMDTPPFRDGVERLLELARTRQTAILCAEALWWRCHRALISDHLKSLGVEVLHIAGADRVEPHSYSVAARIVAGRLTY